MTAPYYQGRGQQIYLGHILDILDTLATQCVQTICTSPPYYGARDYLTPSQIWRGNPHCVHHWLGEQYYNNGSPTSTHSGAAFTSPGPENARRVKDGRWHETITCTNCGAWLGELGSEPHPRLYVDHLTQVAEHLHRVLKEDGTLWLNIGDSYAGGNTGNQTNVGQRYKKGDVTPPHLRKDQIAGIAEKALLYVPARVAIALTDNDNESYILRSDVIWDKINPMPNSATDRPSTSYEHVFLFSKQPQYFYNAEAIAELATGNAHPRRKNKTPSPSQQKHGTHASVAAYEDKSTRNRRDIWRISPEKLPDVDHYAIMPLKLAAICLLAGARPGDTILDPFLGSGTTLVAAAALGMHGIGIELSEKSAEIAARRIEDAPSVLSLVDKPSIDVDSEDWWE